MKKISVFVLLASAISITASAYPSTLRMSCRKAANLVATRGEIVLGTGPHLYDRYVAHAGFCQRDESLRPAYVPTADTASCFVGYTCHQDNRGGGGGGGASF